MHRVHTLLGDVDVTKYILDTSYSADVKRKLKYVTPDGANDDIDCIRALFATYNNSARDIVSELVSPF